MNQKIYHDIMKRRKHENIILFKYNFNIVWELKNGEKSGGVKTSCMVLRFPYDSANCIRFKGYALSSVIKSEHPYPELNNTFNSGKNKLQV